MKNYNFLEDKLMKKENEEYEHQKLKMIETVEHILQPGAEEEKEKTHALPTEAVEEEDLNSADDVSGALSRRVRGGGDEEHFARLLRQGGFSSLRAKRTSVKFPSSTAFCASKSWK